MSLFKMTRLLILGAGGHSRVVIDAALSSGRDVLGLIDIDYKNQTEVILGVDVLGGLDVLDQYNKEEHSIALALGDNAKRKEWFLKLKSIGFDIATVIHPSATISKFAKTGKGCFINSGAIINAEAIIGDNCIINTGVIIDHEVKVESHCHLAPGVSVGGRSVIKESAFVGIGANIADYINIGRDVKIGAGSVIIKDVDLGVTVVGVGRVIG